MFFSQRECYKIMTTRQITMLEAVDEAVERLGPLQRRIVKRRFNRFPQEKLDCCERCMLAATTDTRMAQIGMASVVQGFSSGTIQADTPFSIDLDQFEQFLKILIEYLPKLLEILIPLFTSWMLPLAIAFSLAGSAVAQCPNGQCPLPQRSAYVPYAAPIVEGQPVRNVVRAVAAPVVRVASVPIRVSRSHRPYPGDLGSHLSGTHGVSTAGMSREQMLDLHDSLHESRAYAPARAPQQRYATRPLRTVFGRRPVRSWLFGRWSR
jgi:hypothetical protein